MRKALLAVAGVLSVAAAASAATSQPQFGTPATPAEIRRWSIDVEPDGAGLPAGSGDAARGAVVYAARCAACHGADLGGRRVPGHGAFPALVGGAGTLASDRPKRTVGSFWPYATTVFDYIRRAMPFDRPQTLSNDDVYAVTALILARNGIIAERTVLDARALPRVVMPNRNGFYVNTTRDGVGAH